MQHHIFSQYDALFVDLDGTVFAGDTPIEGAVEALAGHTVVYVTNNASRSREQVAQHLHSLGFPAETDTIFTSAMAACSMGRWEMKQRGIAKPKAYVVGDESFRQLVIAEGFDLVMSADEKPDIVFQGHSPENSWAELSEAALSISRGAVHIASNLDTTLPSERGMLVGNGSMVAAVVSATGIQPQSAGKPDPTLFLLAAKKTRSQRPLVIGDRLNTDIAGGNAAGFDTMCVFTGVSGHWDVLSAPQANRPTYIAANMRDYLTGWRAENTGTTEKPCIRIFSSLHDDFPQHSCSDFLPAMAAAAASVAAPLVWQFIDRHSHHDTCSLREQVRKIEFYAGDDTARLAMDAWR